jgi:hypothetical protein
MDATVMDLAGRTIAAHVITELMASQLGHIQIAREELVQSMIILSIKKIYYY